MKKKFVLSAIFAALTPSTLLFANSMSETSILNAQETKSKILVTYFTSPETDGLDASSGASRIIANNNLYGATEYIAKIISDATGGDIFQIKTQHTYPTHSHKELIDYAKKEAESKIYPKISTTIQNFASYDVIFVGYPNWWYDMPMVIYTLLNEYDFKGKTIVPFCTHGGSGFSQSIQTITNMEKSAKVVRGPAISRDKVSESHDGLVKWLQGQAFTTK